MINLNEQQAKALLMSLLLQYRDILIPDSGFIDDLLELLSSSGMEKRLISKLTQYIKNLSIYGEDAIGVRGDSMEHLSGYSGLNSMRFLFDGANIRILFAFLDRKIYLLCAFYERKGKKNTEYSSYIPIALQRLNELLEGENK